ncbi:LPXTG cell wall anchor domain-containing protein [Corynebacterium godavarianum]|uniref:LPXTG cell wall anchor domain-containing protein n=1 Tax=Corynebacterium godavarianum TaxID=2054421 RepID=A0ABY3E5E2_9CORY|nr:LPXTG cell wall anchor domain-containing protein [Corynebacterium godavarianum]MBL7284887.1 LPXTG cell wall anchor domain-containing protein [Corynebacterium godavarianum]TSJ74904.1 LPXTG cell wall anchor domain-containing protein [Corynebacterium godavarianum]
MNLKKHTGKLSCVALAAAVAGTVALAPVASAQDPSLAAGLADLASKANEALPSAQEAPAGTGSYQAHFTSGGWAYTALALNPFNDRVYAVSKAEQGKPANHLLRIHPVTGEVLDMGPLALDDATSTPTITSAAFTRAGDLVLNTGDAIHTLDLSQDAAGSPHEGALTFDFHALEQRGETDVKAPHAWGSLGGDADANTLYAVSTGKDPKTKKDVPFLWTLDVREATVSAEPLAVARGVDAAKVGDLNYAYTNRGGNLVFADDKASTVEVKDAATKPLLIAATTEGTRITDNFLNLASLRAGAWYKPVTEPQKPSAEPAVPRVATGAPTEPTVKAAEQPSPSAKEPAPAPAPAVPTEVAEVSEPSSSVSTQAPAPTAAEARDVLVTVMDENAHAVDDYEVIVDEDPSIYAKTDREGQARLSLPEGMGDVKVAAGDELFPVAAGETSLRVQFNAGEADGTATGTTSETAPVTTTEGDESQTSTTTTTGADLEAAKVKLTLLDKDDKPVKRVHLEDRNGDEAGRTNKDGEFTVTIPAGKKSVRVRLEEDDVPKGYKNSYFTVDRDMDGDEIVLKKDSASGDGKYPEKNARISVVDEDDNPVESAVLVSGESILGVTNANGVADVVIPSGDERFVRITLDEVPDGYSNKELVFSRENNSGEIVLKKKGSTTSTKSKPKEILEVMDEVKPLLAGILGPVGAAAGALGGGKAGSKTTGTKSTSTSTTGTSTESTSYSRANLTGGVSTGRTTSVEQKQSVVKRTVSNKKSGSSKDDSDETTKSSSRDGDLAETGTPMTTVITLGLLLLLAGGAYMYMGRRREGE